MGCRPLRMLRDVVQMDGDAVAVDVRAMQPPETVCGGVLQPNETCRRLTENHSLLCGGQSWRL